MTQSNQSPQITYSLEEVLQQMNLKLENLDSKIDKLSNQVIKIEATLQAQQPLIQKIPDLAEKVGETKNWKQISLVFITAFISSILTGTIGGVIG